MPPNEKLHVDKAKIKEAFDMSHFDLNTVIRGAQLTLVGGEYMRLRAAMLVTPILTNIVAHSSPSPPKS